MSRLGRFVIEKEGSRRGRRGVEEGCEKLMEKVVGLLFDWTVSVDKKQ